MIDDRIDVVATDHAPHTLEEKQQLTRSLLKSGAPIGEMNAVRKQLSAVKGGRLAAARLVARGCRRIGTITGALDMAAGLDRFAGWAEVLAEEGVSVEAVEHGDFTPQGGAEAMHRLLAAHPDLDGVFVASDLMALAAMGELQAAGRRVPDDVALVGFDASATASMTRPPLTTVANPVSQMAVRATDLLLQLLRGEQAPSEVFPTHLVEGGTA